MRFYSPTRDSGYFFAWRKVMFNVWIIVNEQEVKYVTKTAANRGAAAREARAAYPDGVVGSVLPA